MTYIKSSAFQEFLATLEGFDQLPTEVIASLSQQLQPLRYRIGSEDYRQRKNA
jgi:ATP-binding cassette subfamily B protein